LTAQDALQYLINNKGFNNTWTAES
jgi:hypothetical protein